MNKNIYSYEAIGYVANESVLQTLVDTDEAIASLWPRIAAKAMALGIVGVDRVYIEADEDQQGEDECKCFVHVSLIGNRKETENEAPTQTMADFLTIVSEAISVDEMGDVVLNAQDWEVLEVEFA